MLQGIGELSRDEQERLSERLAAADSGLGVLVLDGALVLNVRVGDRIAAELLGPGDLDRGRTGGREREP